MKKYISLFIAIIALFFNCNSSIERKADIKFIIPENIPEIPYHMMASIKSDLMKNKDIISVKIEGYQSQKIIIETLEGYDSGLVYDNLHDKIDDKNLVISKNNHGLLEISSVDSGYDFSKISGNIVNMTLEFEGKQIPLSFISKVYVAVDEKHPLLYDKNNRMFYRLSVRMNKQADAYFKSKIKELSQKYRIEINK